MVNTEKKKTIKRHSYPSFYHKESTPNSINFKQGSLITISTPQNIYNSTIICMPFIWGEEADYF